MLMMARETRYLKGVLKQYGDRLSAGKYHLYEGFRCMALEEPDVRERSDLYFHKIVQNTRMAALARKLNKAGYYTNKNQKTTGEYEAFYTANNFDKVREVKLFSFRRNRMLTICTSPEEAEKQLGQYETFGGAYPMPAVKGSDAYPNAIEISMVDMKPFPGDGTALEAIARSGVRACHSREGLRRVSAEELAAFSHDNGEIQSLMEGLVSKIGREFLSEAFPLAVQHGDLSKDNLIYGEADGVTDFWWIDWEHAAERIFCYDFFFYIIHTAIYYKDRGAFDSYMKGEADEALAAWFRGFGLTFRGEDRLNYFLLCLVIHLKERVCPGAHVGILKRYCKFADENCLGDAL